MGRGLPSDDVEESGSTLLRSNDASCPMLLKPTSFEVTYFWITYVFLTSCRLGGSISMATPRLICSGYGAPTFIRGFVPLIGIASI